MIVRAAGITAEPTSHGTLKRVILRGGAVAGITQVAIAEFAAGDAVEPHVHPTMYEFFYVMEGRGEYRIGEERCEAGPGDFLMVPPATSHSILVLDAPHRVFYWGLAGGA